MVKRKVNSQAESDELTSQIYMESKDLNEEDSCRQDKISGER